MPAEIHRAYRGHWRLDQTGRRGRDKLSPVRGTDRRHSRMVKYPLACREIAPYIVGMWENPVAAVIYPEDVAQLLKKLFAQAWIRQPDNAFAAAREVEQHPGKAHWIATNWIDDEVVVQERARLIAELGPIAKVPTKEEFAAELYQRGCKLKEGKDQLNYFETFAKVMNYIEKDTVRVPVTVNNTNNHLHMARDLTDDDLARIAAGSGNRIIEA